MIFFYQAWENACDEVLTWWCDLYWAIEYDNVVREMARRDAARASPTK